MAKTLRDRFPVVYEAGKPQAVIVDVDTFDRMLRALERLQQLANDPEEARWILQVVEQARAHRKAHPEEVLTYDSPEAIMAALSEDDTE